MHWFDKCAAKDHSGWPLCRNHAQEYALPHFVIVQSRGVLLFRKKSAQLFLVRIVKWEARVGLQPQLHAAIFVLVFLDVWRKSVGRNNLFLCCQYLVEETVNAVQRFPTLGCDRASNGSTIHFGGVEDHHHAKQMVKKWCLVKG